MINILDHIAKQRAAFVPRDTREYFALQLARKLEAAHEVGHYLALTHSYPESVLAAAYRRLNPQDEASRSKAYDAELTFGTFQGARPDVPVLGVRLERRAVGVVLLSHGRIDYAKAIQLASSADAATKSVRNLIGQLLPRLAEGTVAIEVPSGPADTHRQLLTAEVVTLLRENLISIWEAPAEDVARAVSIAGPEPPAKVREIAQGLWLSLAGPVQAESILLVAALVAVFVRTERELSPD